MRTIKRNLDWFPSLLENLIVENKLDAFNYETFSNPAVNIKDNFTNFVVELAVPGFKKDDFSIEVKEDTLKIASKAVSDDESGSNEETTKFTRREFNFKQFERTFKLPESVNVDDILANYESGILHIILPKKEEKKQLKRMVEIS